MTAEACNSDDSQEWRVVKSADLRLWQQRHMEYFEQNLPLVEAGTCTVRAFCEGLGLLVADAHKMIACSSPSYDEWKSTVLKRFPDLDDAAFAHEAQHAEVAERHGLSVLYQVMIVRSRMFGEAHDDPQLLINDGLERGAMEWAPQQLLAYWKEMLSAPGEDMSEMDRKMLPKY